jgi:hypothetical protein
MVAAYPIVALIGSQMMKMPIWETAALAAAICWLSATIALIAFHFFRQRGNGAAGTLIGTLVRLGIPVVIGIAATNAGGKLRDEGFFGLIVVFYMVALAADTILALALARLPASGGRNGMPHG